jgi:DNA-binding transcriptional regulator YiaG
MTTTLESLSPANLGRAIATDDALARRVLVYLDARGIEHSGRISGATLAAVCGVDSRTWRRWIAGDVPMPTAARRLLALVASGARK